jgi:hypothetical protein
MAGNKPSYRLQPVLEQRQRRREEAERVVADAKKELRQQMERLSEMMECKRQLEVKRQELVAEFEAMIGQPGVALAEESLRHDRYQKILLQKFVEMDGAIARQRNAVRQAELKIDAAKQALLKAITDLKAMEKHKETWEEQVKREAREREQEVQEELGQTMWLQQRQRRQRRANQG